MLIYLVRHADALAANSDEIRPLSPKGIDDTKRVGKFLKKINIKVDSIYHSGLLRARQTAEILQHDLQLKCLLVKKDGLRPEDPVDVILTEIHKIDNNLMIIGHMPHLSSLLSKMVIGVLDPQIVDFKKGAIVCLEKDERLFRIKWLLTPKLMP